MSQKCLYFVEGHPKLYKLKEREETFLEPKSSAATNPPEEVGPGIVNATSGRQQDPPGTMICDELAPGKIDPLENGARA